MGLCTCHSSCRPLWRMLRILLLSVVLSSSAQQVTSDNSTGSGGDSGNGPQGQTEQQHHSHHANVKQLELVTTLSRNITYMIPHRYLKRAYAYPGERERARLAFHKLLTGEKFKLVFLGGSITLGSGAVDAPPYALRVEEWLKQSFPNAEVHMGAVGGTQSSYMALCILVHCPLDADMVILEYAVNDGDHPQPLFANPERSGMERLIRKLLAYPNRPNVMLFNAMSWSSTQPPSGNYWVNAEAEFLEFATYYSLPMMSVKAATWHLMKQGKPGFKIEKYRLQDNDNKEELFYYDEVHPNGQTGHRVLAEILINYFLDGLRRLALQPIHKMDAVIAEEPLPPPMIPGNWPAGNNSCLLGNHFQNAVVANEGWEWINESKTARPKFGYISKSPGKTIKFSVNTDSPSSSETVAVQLLHLTSYEHMGRAMIKCEGGCTCSQLILEGHKPGDASQLDILQFSVTKSPDCVISATVLPDTTSGEYKVKLAGLVVSEGGNRIQANTFEYVHDITLRGNGTYESRNHAL